MARTAAEAAEHHCRLGGCEMKQEQLPRHGKTCAKLTIRAKSE
jgi:hypothetical protein